jgi:hypothetical protein
LLRLLVLRVLLELLFQTANVLFELLFFGLELANLVLELLLLALHFRHQLARFALVFGLLLVSEPL